MFSSFFQAMAWDRAQRRQVEHMRRLAEHFERRAAEDRAAAMKRRKTNLRSAMGLPNTKEKTP